MIYTTIDHFRTERWFFALALSLIAAPNLTIAQSPYELNLKRELALFGGGAAVGAIGLLLQNTVDPLTAEQVSNLKIANIPKFDRQAVYNNHTTAGNISDHIRNGGFFLPVILLVDQQTRKDWPKLMLLASEGLALTSGLTTLAKSSFKRTGHLFTMNKFR